MIEDAEQRIDRLMRLVVLTSTNLLPLMREVEYLLPDKRDRAEFYARLSVSLFSLSYSYSRGVMLDKLSEKQRRDASVRISEMMRDAADVVEGGNTYATELVK